MTLSPNTILSHERGAQGSRLGNDFVVLDAEGRTLRGLNLTGARIWELLDGEQSIAAIAQRIADEQRADRREVLHDALAFVETLHRCRLVRPSFSPLAVAQGAVR